MSNRNVPYFVLAVTVRDEDETSNIIPIPAVDTLGMRILQNDQIRPDHVRFLTKPMPQIIHADISYSEIIGAVPCILEVNDVKDCYSLAGEYSVCFVKVPKDSNNHTIRKPDGSMNFPHFSLDNHTNIMLTTYTTNPIIDPCKIRTIRCDKNARHSVGVADYIDIGFEVEKTVNGQKCTVMRQLRIAFACLMGTEEGFCYNTYEHIQPYFDPADLKNLTKIATIEDNSFFEKVNR